MMAWMRPRSARTFSTCSSSTSLSLFIRYDAIRASTRAGGPPGLWGRGTVEEGTSERGRIGADQGAERAADLVIGPQVDAAPQARLAGLVGGVVVGSPSAQNSASTRAKSP